MMLPPMLVSLPFKVLFVVADGGLVVYSVVNSFKEGRRIVGKRCLSGIWIILLSSMPILLGLGGRLIIASSKRPRLFKNRPCVYS